MKKKIKFKIENHFSEIFTEKELLNQHRFSLQGDFLFRNGAE